MKSELHENENSQYQTAHKWKTLVTVAFGTAMCTMDFSIINISFPMLTKYFKTELATVMWVGLSYNLVTVSLMLILGKVSDIFGRKNLYLTGSAVFTLGLITCSLSQTIGQLIIFRVFQALGASMIISCSAAIVTDAFPQNELGKGLGLLNSAVAVGFILGPVLGGLLLRWFDWSSIFYMRIPLGLSVLIMSVMLLKKDSQRSSEMKRFDFMGTFASSIGLFFLIFGISRIRGLGIGSWLVLTYIFIGLAALSFFIFIERKANDPILDLSLYGNRLFRNSITSIVLHFLATSGYVLLLPFYLIEGINMSPSEAGALLAITAISNVIVSPFSGSLSDRFGAFWLSAIGAGIILITFIMMHHFDLNSHINFIIFTLFLLGVGIGTYQAPINSIIMGAVGANRRGTASALISTKRTVGLALGTALAGTIYSVRIVVHQASQADQGITSSLSGSLSVSRSFQEVMTLTVFLQVLTLLFIIYPRIFKGKGE